MRIAVYSGSFDPLHIGHKAVMEALCRNASFDWVYLIVSPQNPLKDASKAKSAADRFEAARQALRRHPQLRVWADDIELKMTAPHYTVKTLDALRKRERSNRFTLVIGADNLGIIRQWREYGRILLEYGVVVFPREGTDLDAVVADLKAENPEYRIEVLQEELVTVSSTQIREALAEGRDVQGLLM